MSACICPHCGYDLEQDAPVEFGRLSYDPRMGVMLDGKRLRMAPQCHIFLSTLMRAPGKIFKKAVIVERMGYEGDWQYFGDVILCRVRQALREAGLRNLIVTVWGTGIYFNPAAASLSPLSPRARHSAELECQ